VDIELAACNGFWGTLHAHVCPAVSSGGKAHLGGLKVLPILPQPRPWHTCSTCTAYVSIQAAGPLHVKECSAVDDAIVQAVDANNVDSYVQCDAGLFSASGSPLQTHTAAAAAWCSAVRHPAGAAQPPLPQLLLLLVQRFQTQLCRHSCPIGFNVTT
jgi:hypothetical protein